MLATSIVAFREFLEALLIVGVFLGISSKLQLKRELEIIVAAAIGIGLSLIMATVTYFFADVARGVITERNADILGSYLPIFSGILLALCAKQRVLGTSKKFDDWWRSTAI